jgi:hypothetical protein
MKLVQSQPAAGFREFSTGKRLSGVRWKFARVSFLNLAVLLSQIVYFVMPHDDIQVHQFRSFDTLGLGIVFTVDMWGIAIVVCVPGQP